MASGRLVGIAALGAFLALVGCRSVWVHEDWYQGRFAEDYGACRAQEAEQRAAFLTTTREEVCEEIGEGRRVCREVTRGGVRNITPWKLCMLQRGWQTEVGFRSDPISRPRSKTRKPRGGRKR